MATSNDPIRETAEILRRHIDRDTLEKIVNEVLEVRGNKSFRDLVARLVDELIRK